MPKDPISQLSQEDLIRGIKDNERKVMTALYVEVFPKVKHYILKNNGDEDEAKDIFQEAFLVAWKKVKKGEFIPQNSSAMKGFLFQISKNKWLDWLRSSKFKREQSLNAYPLDVSDDSYSGDLEDKMLKLEAGFLKLGENCKELLKRFYFQKMSVEDLAQSFGWTAQTAKNNKYRCMETLRKLMKS
ncbi:RNA polymerase sigma factor [Algoriphagus litoralis]|uniref:RNA polymerase sigma factor n=1 Tax=Algoriphagus litoralis TaxID=2202829 RepID=UPI000DB9CA8E|nr:sigma-70 family RNA polymerase sigma factor [Algoriphagus litoralis]